MDHLDDRDRELVALGAAISSNCIPCIEYHVPAARAAGLSDSQIREVVRLADRVRRVPARKVVQTARALLGEIAERKPAPAERGCGCEESTAGAGGVSGA